MHLTGGEKKLLVAACVAALVVGAFAGYVAYALEEEHQFHGGVLEEDAAQAMWHLRWAALGAFAQIGVITFFVIAVVPLSLRRFLSGVFLWAWVLTMAPMFLVVRYFESANVFDSIGAWYTFFVAAVFSLPVGVAVTVARAALLAGSKEGP